MGDTVASLHTLGGRWGILSYSNPNVPSPDQIFMGRGESLPRIGYSRQDEPKILQDQARSTLQIVSHTLRVWRLMKRYLRGWRAKSKTFANHVD